jgi:16S rRNA pseudouridine516 synthase
MEPHVVKLARYLANLGYGTRREARQLIDAHRVTTAAGVVLREGDACEHDAIRVDGEPLDPPAGSVILLHKPAGFVCSARDIPPLVYELLPGRFRLRSPIIAPIGRLDRDTSGLLLLTDDGQLNHRLTSPRSRVPKRYEATLAAPLTGSEVELFASGTLVLDGETTPLLPAVLAPLGERRALVTMHEGRYHQVRRMFAATGNHVVALHRVAVGSLELGELAPGEWRVLQRDEREQLEARR